MQPMTIGWLRFDGGCLRGGNGNSGGGEGRGSSPVRSMDGTASASCSSINEDSMATVLFTGSTVVGSVCGDVAQTSGVEQ
eukprot:COSAG02_NODE_2073_length_9931_cov_12.650020_5_plen_80_part_00